ncbi:MAG: hypothetical protein JXA09_17130 [Anaerolineae bacterium]|nr:hypothetical protein [Anaerolineae bacterium]
MTELGVNPYIGPKPFTRRDRDRFYGRERESDELLALVLSQRTVLFYAASGAGKSSLINARLIPALQERGYEILPPARVSGVGRPAAAAAREAFDLFAYNVKQSLVSMAIDGAPDGEVLPVQAAYLDSSLSDFLLSMVPLPGGEQEPRFALAGTVQAPSIDEASPPPPLQPRFLVIDQFEEIFTNPQAWAQRDGFLRALRQAQEDDPYLWILLAMREDYLARLDPYLDLFPDRLRARYSMQRMDANAALQAIQRPVAEWLPPAQRRPFDPGVAEELVENLCQVRVATDQPGESRTGRGEYVEPVQLQIVCQQMWGELRSSPKATITRADLAHLAGGKDLSLFVSRALQRYYEDAIAAVLRDPPVPVSEREIRVWFSTRLITETGTRGFVQQGEHDTGGLPNPVVLLLERKFLVRAETRAGGIWYELTHDRFIDVIVPTNREWLEAETRWLPNARRWEQTGEPDELLPRGIDLKEAIQWRDSHRGEISALEERYIEAAIILRDREAAERMAALERQAEMDRKLAAEAEARREAEAGRARAQARAAGRLRWAVVALASGLALALIAIGVALWQRKVAVHNADLALSSQLAAQAQITLEERPDLALLLSVAGAQRADTVPARGSLLAALARSSHREAYLWGHVTYDPVVSLAFAPDGQTLVSGSQGGAVVRWDTGNYQDDRNLDPLSGSPYDVAALSADGAILALGDTNGTLSLWDLHATPPTSTTITGEVRITGLAFSPGGSQLAVGYRDHSIRLWELAAMRPTRTLTGHQDTVSNLAFSPDGRTLASGGGDGAVFLWDLHTGRPRDLVFVDRGTGRQSEVKGVETWVYSLAFSPDGQILAIGTADGSLNLWAPANVMGIPGVPAGLYARKSLLLPSGVLALTFSPDGQTLASGDALGTVTLWPLYDPRGTMRELAAHTAPVRALAFSPDGTNLASGAGDGGVSLWSTGPQAGSLSRALLEPGRRADSIALSPDGKTLALASSAAGDASFELCDLEDDRRIEFLRAGEQPLIYLAFDPGGTWIAGLRDDGRILVWDRRGEVYKELDPGTPVVCMAFNVTAEQLAMAEEDGRVTLWHLDTGERRAVVYDPHSSPEQVNVTAFSPDGRLWATGYAGGTVTVRELSSGTQTHEIQLKTTVSALASGQGNREIPIPVSALAFDPLSQVLAIGGQGGELYVWDLETEATAVQPTGDRASSVLRLVFSLDGSQLAVGYASGALLLCAGGGQRPACLALATQGAGIADLGFRGDGEQLVVRDDAGIVTIWDLHLETWVDRACQIANRSITEDEWAQFVAGAPYRSVCAAVVGEEGSGGQ